MSARHFDNAQYALQNLCAMPCKSNFGQPIVQLLSHTTGGSTYLADAEGRCRPSNSSIQCSMHTTYYTMYSFTEWLKTKSNLYFSMEG